jgi:HAD superfamily hydrolase (TIGR01509 family)
MHDMKGPSIINCFGRKIKSVIFDIDGTLTDSTETYYEVFRKATARVGIQVKREDVLEPMATGSYIWDRAIPKDIPNREEKIKRCMSYVPQIFREGFKSVRPFSGVEMVLKALGEREIKLGLVTASWALTLQPLHDHSLTHYFKAIITSDDGYPPKPAPEGTLECLKRMGVSPSHALTIGDSPLDIRAGKAAGTLTIGVLSGIANRTQLEAEGPTAIIEGIGDLLTNLNLK